MTIDITEERTRELLTNFIENPTFYKYRDFKEVRDIIVDEYRSDYKVLEQISKNDKTRHLLSSSRLLQTIITEIYKGSFEYILDEKSDDIFFVLKQLNLHEDRFITNIVATASLEFITFIIPIIDKEIVNTEKLKENKNEIGSLYSFFKKSISKLNLQQADQTKYQNLFNKIEQLFAFNNYKNAATWFKFYFYFRDKKKFTNNIESNVVTHVSTFIRTAKNQKILKKTIEDELPVEEFTKISNNYLNELYKKSIASPDFAIEFYPFFDDTKKQTLLESWVLKNSNQATKVIKGINIEVPDVLGLANKIINRAKALNNNLSEKKAFLDLLFTLKLTKEEVLSTDYSKQVISLVFNTNIGLHNFGITELEEHRGYIDTKSMKPKAETFMNSILGNPNAYYKQIENIINSKVGITTTFIDKFIVSNRAYINATSQYLISSGNLDFYKSLTSKLNDSTISMITNTFINGISKNQKFYSIVNYIKSNYYELLDANAKSKLEALINK
jgi:hypothetical protein